MIVLVVSAAVGFILGLYGSKRRKAFIPAIALVVAALILTTKHWMPHIGIDNKVDGDSLMELMTNFINAMSITGKFAIPVFVASIGIALYVGTVISAYQESRGEDPYKKKLRILSEHGMKEFD